MPCLFMGVAAIFPRFALLLMWFTQYTGTAFNTHLWPILGFFFLPYTTCAYAIGMNESAGFQGWTLVLLIIGILLDFGTLGGSGSRFRKRR